MENVVIVSGSRTAIGSYGGTLKSTPVVDLGAVTLKKTLENAGLRPLASEECIKFGADAIREDGVIELESRYHDYDRNQPSVMIDQVVRGRTLPGRR
jgi:acetyl-CoA C-acetyltransferase